MNIKEIKDRHVIIITSAENNKLIEDVKHSSNQATKQLAMDIVVPNEKGVRL